VTVSSPVTLGGGLSSLRGPAYRVAVRATGSLDTLPSPDRGDHVCWVHGGDDDATFDDAVRSFLAGGLARGERLLCVGERVIDSVRAEAEPFTDVEPLVAAGTLQLMTVADAYAATGDFSAERQFAYYDSATRQAVAEGYAGLRVVAELTALAADPTRDELVRWEHLADRYIVEGPGMTAMCAYADSLPAEALADVTAAHPAAYAPPGLAPFHVFFDGDALALAGSVDLADADRLARVLADSPSAPAAVLDVTRLTFVDVAGSRAIARWAGDLRRRGVTVEIRGASRLFRRIWRVLALHDVASVTFAGASA
jgi:anti-anti-sigma regulatory factor